MASRKRRGWGARLVTAIYVSTGILVASAALLRAAQADYVIGYQDVLSITVWDQTDLGGEFAVDADGTFTFPLIGRVEAGGKSLRQLETELVARLKDGFFVNPQLTVRVEQFRSQRVFVVGEVRSPGTYVLSGEMTLIEVLARAGSTLPSAAEEVVIARRVSGPAATGALVTNAGDLTASFAAGADAPEAADEEPTSEGPDPNLEVTRIDIQELQNGALGGNILLRDRDTVFVPRAPTAFVFGHVRNPGEYAVKSGTSVLQALSLAGGVTDRGSTSRIRIVRLVDGEKREIDVDLDDLVREGDTVMVRERFF